MSDYELISILLMILGLLVSLLGIIIKLIIAYIDAKIAASKHDKMQKNNRPGQRNG